MTTKTLSKLGWTRLLPAWLRRRKTVPITRKSPLTIWELESRVPAGSLFDVLLGGLAFGHLLPGAGAGLLGDASATAVVQQDDSPPTGTRVTDLSATNLPATDPFIAFE